MGWKMDAAQYLLLSFTTMSTPNTLTATELAQRLDAGTVTAEQIVRRIFEVVEVP